MKTGTVLDVAPSPVLSRGTSYGHWLCHWVASSPFGGGKQIKDLRFFKKKEAEDFLATLRDFAARGEVYPPLTGEEKRDHCWGFISETSPLSSASIAAILNSAKK